MLHLWRLPWHSDVGPVSQKSLCMCAQSHISWNSNFLKLANINFKESASVKQYHKHANEIICNKSYYWLIPNHMTQISGRMSFQQRVSLRKPERGYNPETPCNFSHHSRVISTGWHTHLSYDWWRLPSGEAALASPCWKAPSNSSLDWTIVGVTLGPDSEVSVWVLGTQCWG